MKTLISGLLLAGLATAVLAETQRQHGAHEHGAARLSLATEGAELVIVLDSPAYNIFGFEHRPSTAAQRSEVDAAVTRLRAGTELFTPDRAAGCQLEETMVDTPLMDGHHDDEGHGHEEDDGHHHDDEGHAHEDEGHHHDDEDHAHEEVDHHHEGDEDEAAHSDVRAEWHFHCDDPAALTRIEVGLFEAFANLDDLDVQYLTDTVQGGVELAPGRTTLRLE